MSTHPNNPTTSPHNMAKMDQSNEDPEEASLRQSLAQADVQRRSMELEADAIYLELTTPPSEGVQPMGLDTPLIDADGYPRGDIDLYRARDLRNRFRVLQTDHKEIEAKIQNLLLKLAALKNPHKKEQEERERQARLAPKPKPKYDPQTGKWVVMNWDGTVAGVKDGDKRRFDNLDHQVSGLTADEDDLSAVASQNTSTRSAQRNGTTATANNTTTQNNGNGNGGVPFARIDAVATDSPAEEAGLKEEDLIVAFGDLHAENHSHLKAIAELVPTVAAEQKGIQVRVQRHYTDESIELTLFPKPWSGRGMLGCHIVPYAPPS